MKKKLIAISMIAFLSVPFMANAEQNDAPPPPPPHSQDHGPSFRFSPFEGIKLTDQQKEKIDAIRKEGESKKIDIFKDGFEAEKRVRELVTSNDYSKEQVEKIVRQATERLVDTSVERADKEHRIFEVLTVEQQAKYKENITNIESKISERGRPHFDEGKPVPPPAPHEDK